jgi:predicted lipoprotein with Yx(FWY)xxD motif
MNPVFLLYYNYGPSLEENDFLFCPKTYIQKNISGRNNGMKNLFAIFRPRLICCFIAAAVLLGNQANSWANEMVGVKIMEKEGVGKYLADGNGVTLYSYAKDEKNTSNCIEGCAVNWPPFYVDLAAVGEGLAQKDFAVITRSDGRLQTTYKSMPLYYFKNDKFPGDTFGQGLGDAWFLIVP